MKICHGLALLMFCTACAAGGGDSPRPVPAFMQAQIEQDAEGRCWGHDIQPAVIETVTVQELVTPAVTGPDGGILVPATYRSVIRQQIARERQAVAFETLCPPHYTQDFVESLQRALAARGYYRGPVNGRLDAALGQAVQDYQRATGPDSPLLSMAAARRLGLVPLSPEELAAL